MEAEVKKQTGILGEEKEWKVGVGRAREEVLSTMAGQ